MNLQYNCYYYSYWVSDFLQDTAFNEAVYTYISEESYTKNEKITGSVLEKRQISNNSTLVPWPMHAFGTVDFRPGLGLLHKNIEKDLKVDSILSKGNQTNYYYTILKPIQKKVVFSEVEEYHGKLVYDELEKRISLHEKNFVFKDREPGFLTASYQVSFDTLDSLNLPSLIKLSYTAKQYGSFIEGQDISRVNEVRIQDLKIPDNYIYKIKEAAYHPEFWENYNRIR